MLKSKQKVTFDPYNAEHVKHAQQFFNHTKWGAGGNPFTVTYPHISIVHEMQSKLLKRAFDTNVFA